MPFLLASHTFGHFPGCSSDRLFLHQLPLEQSHTSDTQEIFSKWKQSHQGRTTAPARVSLACKVFRFHDERVKNAVWFQGNDSDRLANCLG